MFENQVIDIVGHSRASSGGKSVDHGEANCQRTALSCRPPAFPYVIPFPPSPATSHRPASRTEIAPVLPDHRQVAALVAQLSGRRLRRGAAHRRLQDAHLLQRQAGLVEDAEHRVAVDDQLREVGDGRGVVGLAAGAGDESHEVAERLGVVEQLG